MNKDMNISYGELWVQGNKITYIGVGKKNEVVWDREIDVQGNLLMPGFKDAHTHSAMTFLRSFADDFPLMEWLEKQVFPMEAKLTPEYVYWLCKLAIMEYLTSGITSNFDMYSFTEAVAKASTDCGFRTVLVSGLNDFNSSLEELEAEYLKYNQYNSLISYVLGFHAEYTTSEKLLKGVAAMAKKYQAPVFSHNSETENEVRGCIDRHGMSPMCYLDSLGIFEYGGGGYHCVHMADQDLDVCQKHNLTIVTNPGSNTKLASGVPRMTDILKRDICVAIGTDGPASNNCLDMFREMFLVTGLAKLRDKDAAAVPAEKVLQMAVQGGARAMNLKECDCLAEGKLADIILIDLHQPNMQPMNNIVKNLVYSGSKQNVKMTMVNGQILYEDGKFYIGEQPEVIYRKANEIIASMV